jgi:3',5'-cyclic AMP phosphodiesterase CpdA
MKIAVVSDTHLTPRAPAFTDNWHTARAWIREAAPDLVVHLGDITADGQHDAAELESASAAFVDLGCPILFLPGNHDVGDNPVVPGAGASSDLLDPARLEDYRRTFGPDRWSIDACGWQLVGVNAQLFGTGSDEEEAQFRWLHEQLDRGAGPVALLVHKPLFRDISDDHAAHGRYVPLAPRRRLLAACGGRDLRLVLSGHVHQSRQSHVGAVEHVWVPSTACCLPDAIQERIGEKVVGVVLLDLTESGYRIERITPSGMVRHNVLDQPIYAKYAELKATLGSRAALP